MAGRVQDLPYRGGARSAARYQPREARPLLSRAQRFQFVGALAFFALATAYAALIMLTHTWPAIFKGEEILPQVTKHLDVPIIGIKPPSEDSVFNRRVNVLVIGSDKRPGEDDAAAAYRTDTIMILSMDPVSQSMTALSFPRDMVIKINVPPGFVDRDGTRYSYAFQTEDRINSSYQFGWAVAGGREAGEKAIEGGARQLVNDIKLNFGIDIDHWVLLDFKGVQALVDAIGGVEVNIPNDLYVPAWDYSDDDRTHTIVRFDPGIQTLDGYHAVAFGRYRDGPGGDLNRIKRQQLVLAAALDRIFSAKILDANPRDLWEFYGRQAHHDVGYTDAVSYIPLFRKTEGDILAYSVADPVGLRESVFPYTTPQGAAVLGWDPQNVKFWINMALIRSRYLKSWVVIENATGPVGLDKPQRLSDFLRFEKFLPAVDIGQARSAQPTTQIVLRTPHRRPMADDIAGWMGLPDSAVTEAPRQEQSGPDIVIILGEDWKAPPPLSPTPGRP